MPLKTNCCCGLPCDCPVDSDYLTPTVLTGVRSVISGIPNTFTHNKTIYTENWQVPFSGPPCYTIDTTTILNITVSGLAALNGTYNGTLGGAVDCPHVAYPYPDPCFYLINPGVFCIWEWPVIPEIDVDVTIYRKVESFNNNTMMGTVTESTTMVTGKASFGWRASNGAAPRALRIEFLDTSPVPGSPFTFWHVSPGSPSSAGFSTPGNADSGDTTIKPAGAPNVYEVMCDDVGDSGTASNASKNTTTTSNSTPSSPTCAGLGHMNYREETEMIDGYTVNFYNETYV